MGLSMFSLKDKVAIVTGRGGGIGKGTGLEFAEAGANVVVAGINIYDQTRTEADLEAVAGEIRGLGSKALAVPADVRESAQVDNMVQKAVEAFGGIDILVNNVGGMFFAHLLEISEKGWDATMRENLKVPFLCSKAVASVMVQQKRGDAIINIASGMALVAYPQAPHYAAAKAGVIHLTKSMAVELAPYHIRVNAIAPGLIEHESQTQGRKSSNQPTSEADRAAILKQIPLGHTGRPRDIAAAALYLASDASRYVTGSILVADGVTSLRSA